jgi:hypothetical protein
MFPRIKSSVVRFLHKLRHSDSDDMNAFDEYHADLFPPVSEHITIATYCRALERINKTIGTKQLQSYQIPTIEGFKTDAMSRHEYARANVSVPGTSTKTLPLSFERMQGKNTIDVDTTSSKSLNTEPEAPNLIAHSRPDLRTLTARIASSSKSSLNSVKSKSSFNSPSTSLSPQRFADDKVAVLPTSGTWGAGDRHIFTLTFDSRPLYLYELAFLVEVIHGENQTYHLLSNNCYHLVGIISTALVTTHGAKLKLSEENDDIGKCCGVDIFAKGERDVTIICEKFLNRLETFVSLLYLRD